MEEGAEIPLGGGFSLVPPRKWLLSASDRHDMTGREREEHEVSRYLVYKHEQQFPPNTQEEIKNVFFDGLIALQVLRPIRTLGIVFYGDVSENSPGSVTFLLQTIERRPPMEPPGAKQGAFCSDEIERLTDMIESVRTITRGPSAELRNAFILLQLGLEHFHPLIAGLLWVTGLEAIFDSGGREEFKKRICGRLGGDTPVFPNSQRPTVSEIAIDLFMLRSKLAHGSDLRKARDDNKYPIDFLERRNVPNSSDQVPYHLLLSEAACHLLRQVLLTEISETQARTMAFGKTNPGNGPFTP